MNHFLEKVKYVEPQISSAEIKKMRLKSKKR